MTAAKRRRLNEETSNGSSPLLENSAEDVNDREGADDVCVAISLSILLMCFITKMTKTKGGEGFEIDAISEDDNLDVELREEEEEEEGPSMEALEEEDLPGEICPAPSSSGQISPGDEWVLHSDTRCRLGSLIEYQS